jgi:translocation and assembly module TamA
MLSASHRHYFMMTSFLLRLTLTGLLLCSLTLAAAPATVTAETGENNKLAVIVAGVDGPLRDNVLALLELNRFAGQTAPEETRLRWLHNRAESQIREALQPFGYYRVVVESGLNAVPNGWEARYQIQPGPPLPIATLDVQILGEGQQDFVFQAFRAKLPLAPGQTLDQPKYEQIKQTLEALATERGYFDAHFTESAIRIDLEVYQAAIHLHYQTGPRYRFGDIAFKQNILSSTLLNRYPRFKPGDPYDANDLLKLQSDLNSSPYFSQIQISAPPDAATHTAPVNVELEPNKKRKYSAGLGYGTDTGARVKFRAEQRWLNQRGHHAEEELQWSTIKSLIGLKYKIPGADPINDEYSLTAGYSQQDYNEQDYQRFYIGGGFQHQDGQWLKNYSLNYQYEEFSVGDQPTSSSLLLIPGLNWTWINADDRLYTRRGVLFGFELRGASTALLSDLNFVQGVLHLKGVYALNDVSRLIARSDVGATAIKEKFEELPTSLRFFTGGDASVRGYAYNTIGPTDAESVVIGGKNLLVASVEYEHQVRDGWSLAAFVDSGDAFDGAKPELKTGVGVGLRWRSPVGPVRIDLASGLDSPPGDAFRFSFSIGPDL